MTNGEIIFMVANGLLGYAIGRGWVDQAAGFISAWVAERFGGPRR
ncbi:hypothetical protein [Burkholderia aenigmatica]|nr:hypothetical protein [Burkholderia aenigmatica]MDN7873837.1 hypothetical protein [Burkholderia aenigmatica]